MRRRKCGLGPNQKQPRSHGRIGAALWLSEFLRRNETWFRSLLHLPWNQPWCNVSPAQRGADSRLMKRKPGLPRRADTGRSATGTRAAKIELIIRHDHPPNLPVDARNERTVRCRSVLRLGGMGATQPASRTAAGAPGNPAIQRSRTASGHSTAGESRAATLSLARHRVPGVFRAADLCRS